MKAASKSNWQALGGRRGSCSADTIEEAMQRCHHHPCAFLAQVNDLTESIYPSCQTTTERKEGTSLWAFALFTIEPMEVTVRKLILASVLAFATTAAVTSPTQAQFLFSPFGGYYGGFGGFPFPYRYDDDYYGDPYYEPYRPYYRYHYRYYHRYYPQRYYYHHYYYYHHRHHHHHHRHHHHYYYRY